MSDGIYASENGLLAMLKTFYAKDGLVNLLYRNDPLLKKLKKERIGGKSANFSALYSRGGAVAASYIEAKTLASNSAKAAEFSVRPGQLFSCCSYSTRELQIAKTQKEAYIPIASAKFFASLESFRKTMATALYGDGYGTLFSITSDITFTENPQSEYVADVTFPRHAVMAIDIGSKLSFKATSATADGGTNPVVEVKKISGTTVTLKEVTVASHSIAYASYPVVALYGSVVVDNQPLLPRGLGAWLPAGTVGSGDSFFDVDRSVARDRLAGSYIQGQSGDAKYKVLEEGIMALRRMGSACDMIIMNDEDYLALQREVEAKTNFMKVDGGKKSARGEMGYKDFGISISTNYLENIIDSPYCPKGKAYILDSETVQLWTFGNVDKIDDGINGNEVGKPDVTGDTDMASKPYQVLVDDCLSVLPGTDTINGPATLIALSFYGQFVVTNPSVNGVVTFAD